MIESRYWKDELARIARTLSPVRTPPRWSERAHCIVERDLHLGFFIIRKMIELHKVSSRVRCFRMKVFSSRALQTETPLSPWAFIDDFDLDNERPHLKRPRYIANQFVHSVISLVLRDQTRNWSDVYIASSFAVDDYTCWRIPMPTIRELFKTAYDDYPAMVHAQRDPNTLKWKITTD